MCPGHPLGYTQHQTEAPKRLSLNFSNSNSTDSPSSKNSAKPSIGLWSNIRSAHPTVSFRNNRFASQSEVANCGGVIAWNTLAFQKSWDGKPHHRAYYVNSNSPRSATM